MDDTGAQTHEWAERLCIGLTLNPAPAKEIHRATEDGHHLVALLKDDRIAGGGRTVFVRLYGESPCGVDAELDDAASRPLAIARSSEPRVPVAPRRMPTLEEIRDALDNVAPAGSRWLFGGMSTVMQANKGATYRLGAAWVDAPALAEIVVQVVDQNGVNPKRIVLGAGQ